ncbi:MAG: N-formylglutamate amidohydrolase [Bdellovibrionaceae bacterium]|nr:N-formylglutamate amidohydrolase [Pseudobdellovibrionaceae bacterium]
MMKDLRLFLSSPHSGEAVPKEVTWLQDLNETVLMCDVDRYVDQLYRPVLQKLDLPLICARWHRYFSDANRLPGDVDQSTVKGHANPAGTFPSGLIWQVTTKGDVLVKEPISPEFYEKLLQNYYSEFHNDVKAKYAQFFQDSPDERVYHIDLHSMPSVGEPTGRIHRDPGERRKEIVVSDQKGQSAAPEFVKLIIDSYSQAGFDVGYNWPYFGGRVTQTYGQPEQGQHCVQVELRRDLYMDENTKQKNEGFTKTQEKLAQAIELISQGMKDIS